MALFRKSFLPHHLSVARNGVRVVYKIKAFQIFEPQGSRTETANGQRSPMRVRGRIVANTENKAQRAEATPSRGYDGAGGRIYPRLNLGFGVARRANFLLFRLSKSQTSEHIHTVTSETRHTHMHAALALNAHIGYTRNPMRRSMRHDPSYVFCQVTAESDSA